MNQAVFSTDRQWVILNWNALLKPCDRTKRKSSTAFPLPEPTSWSSPYQSVISHINQWRSGNLQPFIWSRSHCREIPKDTTTNTGTFQRKAAVSGGIQSKNLLSSTCTAALRAEFLTLTGMMPTNNMRMEVLIVRILTFGRPWRRQLYWSYYWIICPICCLTSSISQILPLLWLIKGLYRKVSYINANYDPRGHRFLSFVSAFWVVAHSINKHTKISAVSWNDSHIQHMW